MQSAPVEYYQDHYSDGAMEHTAAGNIHPGFRYTLKKIEHSVQLYLTPAQRRAIDVGCGTGYLLSELKKSGFDGLGIDFNPDLVRFARAHFHVNAEVTRVEDLMALNSRFDLALLIHVLEHVEDPVGLLKNIRQLLDPGGILFIDLPNLTRFAINRSIRKGGFFWGEYPPHHLTFWSRASLSKALEAAGYSVLECHPRPFGEEGQVELFLCHRLHLKVNRLVSLLAKPMRRAGRSFGLQGETLFAIARRPN
jgi:2-polyprenyl-3-methyl-5-hydroxy-6-metoxy-1,4-benzoquinol methylase